MTRAVLLLAWWFAVNGSYHEHGRVVGPFASEADCNRIRESMFGTYVCCGSASGTKYPRSTVCWSDGKP